MLIELTVENLGVIAELGLVLSGSMTAVTGETGAGKTLIVDAIDLLAGGRADSAAVRDGAVEAVVEGRFVDGDDETVVRRVIPANGRSRAYIDGRMATIAHVAEVVAGHVDLYAQHAQHSLLSVAGRRAALDRYAGTDLTVLTEARSRRKRIREEMDALGGDPASREREMDMLRFQLDELDAAAISDSEEDDRLAAEQELLGDVVANRIRVERALETLVGEDTVLDLLGSAVAVLEGSDVFADERARLAGLAAELDDAAGDLRLRAGTIVEDPERLDAVVARRQVLASLRRRHGDGTLAGVIAEHRRLAVRLAELENAEERSVELTRLLEQTQREVDEASAAVAAARRSAAPRLSEAVRRELEILAMPGAAFTIRVGDADPGDDVEMYFSPNPGMRPTPLARTASGGELARAMLALRLVATADQDTVVFDEVDAGIGGTAAIAVGDALARLGRDRQVLVVTHLAQVAAAADHQVGVVKEVEGESTRTTAQPLVGESRVVELSRMLSGQPTSAAAQLHARELLVAAHGDAGDV